MSKLTDTLMEGVSDEVLRLAIDGVRDEITFLTYLGGFTRKALGDEQGVRKKSES